LTTATFVDVGPLYTNGACYRAIVQAAEANGWPWFQSAGHPEAVARLEGRWESARTRLSASVLRNTTRRLRQLRDMGPVTFAVVDGGSALTATLRESFELEGLGWKGTRGTPIAASDDTRRFYTELAGRYASLGRLALYTLRLETRLIAFQYCVRSGPRLDVLKESYAPDLARLSPGNVLRYLTFEHELRDGTALHFHMGRARDWKKDWTTHLEPRTYVRVYGGTLSALACTAGPRFRAAVKGLLHRTGLRPQPAAHE